jgi:hypothetical protein
MSYTDIQSRAAAMLADKGQTVTIDGETAGTYDTATSSVTGTAYSATAKAVLLPLSPYRQASDSNVQAGDEQMLLSALDATGAALVKPPLNAIITLTGGAKYTLVSIEPLHPDGTELLFDCVVRGNG